MYLAIHLQSGAARQRLACPQVVIRQSETRWPIVDRGALSEGQDVWCGHTSAEIRRLVYQLARYRRFVRLEQLKRELETLGFVVNYVIEKDGLSVYKDDNPVLIRVHARKP